jgi:orotidine-5'-phosphate decarboxylase
LVGLDPRLESLPDCVRGGISQGNPAAAAAVYQRFCEEVIDVVAPMVAAVKPQAAFFEQLGPEGMEALGKVIAYARDEGLLVIIDGKRNDIGSTATAYAQAYLGPSPPSAWGGDGLTVSPYLGADSLQPFVDTAVERDAGIFVLVKTSNPGGGLFQDLQSDDGKAFYQAVAAFVQQSARQTIGQCGYGAVGAVVGATYPAQLAELRQAMPNTWFLVPGYGAQGAGAKDVQDAFAADGLGAIVNSSRGIIFAHLQKEYSGRFGDAEWQRAVEAATRLMIEQLRSATPAGRLGSENP